MPETQFTNKQKKKTLQFLLKKKKALTGNPLEVFGEHSRH